jgi:transposase
MNVMPRKRYSAEFKTRAVELVRMGKPVAEVAQELGIGSGILYRWTGNVSQLVQLGSEGLRAGGEQAAADELHQLRRENTRLKMENDILKKAAVILGTNPPTNGAR